MAFLQIKLDSSEKVTYDRADYPACIRKARLSWYPNFTAESHWHDDVEFITIISGEMQYNINGEIILLKEGEGVFVNARQLHFGYSDNKCDCEFICVLLHPILLCSSRSVEEKYVSSLIFNENIPFCHLSGRSEWEKTVLSAVRYIYNVRNDTASEMKIQRAFFDIWISLFENVVPCQKTKLSGNHHLSVLKDMIAFINDSYTEKVSLDMIAESGKVSKTGCCNIFRRYINKTPNEYLTELRLRKAMELLKNTDMTVLEISYAVGFSCASYFTETFRKFFGFTPTEYRHFPTLDLFGRCAVINIP